MSRSIVAAAVSSLAVVLLAAGCGGGDEAGQPQQSAATETAMGGSTLQLAADPGGALKFDKTTIEAQAGMVMIQLTNDSSVPHNVAIEGEGVNEESETVSGDSTTLRVELQPGTYTFFCSVPGHREAGMKGTLTVG